MEFRQDPDLLPILNLCNQRLSQQKEAAYVISYFTADIPISIPNPSLIQSINQSFPRIYNTIFSHSSKYLLISSSTLTLYKISSDSIIYSFNLPSIQRSIRILPDDTYIILGGEDPYIRIFSRRSCREIFSRKAHDGIVLSVCISRDSRYFISSGSDEKIQIWDLYTNRLLESRKTECLVFSLGMYDMNRYLVAGMYSAKLRIYDRKRGKVYDLLGHFGSIDCLAISNNEDYIISGSEDTMLGIWSTKSMTKLVLMHGHTRCVSCLSLTKDDKYIISASHDGSIRVWSLLERVCKYVLRSNYGSIFSLSISPNSMYLSISSSHQVKILAIFP
jgi:WD40 repeat protein